MGRLVYCFVLNGIYSVRQFVSSKAPFVGNSGALVKNGNAAGRKLTDTLRASHQGGIHCVTLSRHRSECRITTMPSEARRGAASLAAAPLVTRYKYRLARSSTQAGFSLVEVLVALMVVGMALPALLGQMQTQTDARTLLRNKTLAQYVAQNKIVEYRLKKLQGGAKFGSSENGEVELGGARWYWRMTSTDFGDIKAQQLMVEVGLAPDETLNSLMVVVGQ